MSNTKLGATFTTVRIVGEALVDNVLNTHNSFITNEEAKRLGEVLSESLIKRTEELKNGNRKEKHR